MGGVLTNVVGFDRAKALSKRIPLSLQNTAVCFSKSAGEFFVADFAVASSAGKQKVETRGARQKKENRIQKFEVEIRK